MRGCGSNRLPLPEVVTYLLTHLLTHVLTTTLLLLFPPFLSLFFCESSFSVPRLCQVFR